MDPQKAPGQHRPGEAFSIPFMGAPEEAEGAAPFYEVFGDYEKAAEKELHREEIPAAFRKQIKDYFESITPTGASGDDKDSKDE